MPAARFTLFARLRRQAALLAAFAMLAAGPAFGENEAAPAAKTPAALAPAANASAADDRTALIKKGEYIARAADCAPCHMAVGGTPFAGGLILNTPFGQMATPNITPDKETGIGDWTDDQFYNALHNGIDDEGKYIYPTMVFPSYTKMSREDVDALHAYLKSLPPVHAPALPVSLHFPFNIRMSLLGWRMLFFRPGEYRPDPAQSAQWNRGAYLVQGAGHCGECHSPRNLLGGVTESQSLAGGVVDGFVAPNISSDPRWGVGSWSDDELLAFLKTGSTHKGVVFGPMVEVVHESMAHLTDDDLRAIVFYLKHSPARANAPAPGLPAADAARSIKHGEAVYAANCSLCHQADGSGAPGAIPNLAGNEAIRGADPTDAIMPVLAGLDAQGDYGAMPRFGGALSDQEAADLANYIRTAWNNAAPANATAAIVASLRAAAAVGMGGSAEARSFGCPKIGDGSISEVLASEADVAMLDQAAKGDLRSTVPGAIAQIRKDNPDASPADIVTRLTAAYCPVVAARTDLSRTQKADALIDFSALAGQQFTGTKPAVIAKAVVGTVLSPDTRARLNQAAGEAGLTPEMFIARRLGTPHS